MEPGHGNQRLPDLIQKIQCYTAEGIGMEISPDVLRSTLSCGFYLHLHRHRVKGKDLRIGSGTSPVKQSQPEDC